MRIHVGCELGFTRSSGVGEDHVFGRKLMLESCRRSSDVNFHFWLWAASSTNVRCRALRAAWTISVSSKSLMLRRIGTWKLMGARTIRDRNAFGFQFNLLNRNPSGCPYPRSEACRAKGNNMQVPAILQGESLKRLLQGAAAGAVATMFVGFSWGGWSLGEDRQMWFYVQMWLPVWTVALTAAICFSVASFIMRRSVKPHQL
jgi:hypothetical protein